MVNQYELMLILKSQTDETSEKKLLKEIKDQMKNGGKIVKDTPLGKKQFAYPIKKEKEGKYWLLNLELTGKEAQELTSKLKLNEVILRYLLLRKD